TLNAELSYKKDWVLDHTTVFGIQNQYQTNQISGYGYLMPAYDRWNTGMFVKHTWNPSADFTFELGARYDRAQLNIEGYFDEVLYDYLTQKGTENSLALNYAQRSISLDKDFSRRSEEHTSELQSREKLVCRLLLEKKKKTEQV